MRSSEAAEKLSALIKKAIEDCEVSTTEYNQIMDMANEDGYIDAQEEKLLGQLQQMIGNGTIKKVPG